MSTLLYARFNHFRSLTVALCCCAGVAHAVVVVEATGSGYVSGDNASTRLAMTVTEQALGGGRSAAGARDLVIDSATDVFAGAAISGSSFAAPGVLKAKIDGLAFVTSPNPNIPTIANGTPVAAGDFGARFADTVLLSSSTLAAGTPVQFVYTVSLHATSNGAGHAGPQFGGYDSASFYFHFFLYSGGAYIDRMYHYPNGLYQSVPNSSFTFPITFNGVIGETISLGAELSVSADDRAGYYSDGAGSFTFYGELQETHLDASNTARFYLDAITSGLQLTAESGHDYATAAIPEPGTWILFALGLGILIIIARKGASEAAAPGLISIWRAAVSAGASSVRTAARERSCFGRFQRAAMPISHATRARRCSALLVVAVLSTTVQGLALAGSQEDAQVAKPAETGPAHDRLYLCVSSREPQRQLILQVDTARRRMQAQATKGDSPLPRGVGSGSIKQDGLNWRQRKGTTSAHRELRLDGELYLCEATHRD